MQRTWTRLLFGLGLSALAGACSSNVNKIGALCQDLETQVKAAGSDCDRLAQGLDQVFAQHKDIKVYGSPPTAEEMERIQGPCVEAQKLIEPCRKDPKVAEALRKYQKSPAP